MRNSPDSFQVNDVKVVQLDRIASKGGIDKILFKVSISCFFASVLWIISSIKYDNIHQIYMIDGGYHMIPFVVSTVGLIVSLLLKCTVIPEKEQRIYRVIDDVLQPLRDSSTTLKLEINEETIDKILTHLKISNLITKTNSKVIENTIISVLLGNKHNRIISRMFQHGLIKANQGIFTTRRVKHYFELMRELIKLGSAPDKVYFEDESDSFAIVYYNLDDAHFANIAQPQDSSFEYVSSNELIEFIRTVHIN